LYGKGSVNFANTGVSVWSDIPNNRLLRFVDGHSLVLPSPSNHANGNTRDCAGRLASYGKQLMNALR